MIVRELVTLLGFKTDHKALSTYERSIKTLKTSLAAVAVAGAAVGAALFKITTDTANAGDAAAKAADQLGYEVEAFQEIEYAASLAGIASGELENSLRRQNKAAVDAAGGSKKIADAYALFGVNAQDANGELKTGDELLQEVAAGYNSVSNETERAAALQEIYGRSGGKMGTLFKGGAEGLKAAREEAQSLGYVISEEVARSSEEFNDTITRMQAYLKGLKVIIGAELIPIGIKMGKAFLKWVIANKDLIKSKIKEYLENFIILMKGLWKIFKNVWAVLAFIVDLFGGLENVVRFAGYALAAFMTIKIGGALWGIVAGVKAMGSAFTVAGAKAALAGIKTAAPFVLVAALILGLILLLDDLSAWGRGEKSIMGEMFPQIAFEDIAEWIKVIKVAIVAVIAVVALLFGGWIPALVAAIGAVAVMLYDSMDDIKAFFSNLFGWIKAEFILMGRSIAKKLTGWFLPLIDAWYSAKANIQAGFKKMIDYFIGLVDKIFSAIARVGDVFGNVAGKARGLLNKIPGVNIGSGTAIAGAAQGGGASGPGVDARRRSNQAANNRSNQTSVGEVSVNIQGSADMSEAELSRATADGINEALGQAYQNAGEAFSPGDY